MGLSKTEVNLKRLLAAAPQQQNQAKLLHYVTTLRELLEQLGSEAKSEGLASISKTKLNEYSEQIEAISARLASPMAEELEVAQTSPAVTSDVTSVHESVKNTLEESPSKDHKAVRGESALSVLRRRILTGTEKERTPETEVDSEKTVRLNASAQAHIEKHRKLQEDLTDEMVVLARQLKESSLVMNQSLEETEKILDSTEKAVEHSLASTGRANVRAMQIYSKSFKTTCFTWLVIFAMTCIFIMVVLLIRVT